MDIGLPIWPAKLVVPVALTILAIRLLLQCWGYFRAFKNNDERPIAIPLIETAAEAAAAEAESVMGQEENISNNAGDKT